MQILPQRPQKTSRFNHKRHDKTRTDGVWGELRQHLTHPCTTQRERHRFEPWRLSSQVQLPLRVLMTQKTWTVNFIDCAGSKLRASSSLQFVSWQRQFDKSHLSTEINNSTNKRVALFAVDVSQFPVVKMKTKTTTNTPVRGTSLDTFNMPPPSESLTGRGGGTGGLKEADRQIGNESLQ